jgi:hypothetical protein
VQLPAERPEGKLPPILRVGRPPAAQPEELADLRAEQRADRGDQVRAADMAIALIRDHRGRRQGPR